MPPINSTLNYNRPRDLAIGRKLAAAGQHQPTVPRVQTTLDVSMPAHAARATALAGAEPHPMIIPARVQTTLDATMPAHAARATALAAHPRAEKKRRIFMIPDIDTDEDSGSDPDVTDLFRARSTKRHKTNEERQRQAIAEARHAAECEANRRAKDARLIRDDAALDAAIANPITFRPPVALRINFNYQSAEEIEAQLGWYPDSDSDGDDVYEIVESRPGQTTFEIRDPTTGRCTWKDNRRRAFTHLQMNGGFLYQAEESGKTGPWFKAVHVDSFETFVAIARRGGHVYSLIGQHDALVYLDIDAKKAEMVAANKTHDQVIQMSMRGIHCFFREYYEIDVASTDFFCAESCSPKKASWHLHLHRSFSADERETFRGNLIQAKRDDPNMLFVDASPYTTTCSLRCIGSSKVGSDRVLKPCRRWGGVEFAYKQPASRVEDGITYFGKIDTRDYLPNNPSIISIAPVLVAVKRAVVRRDRTVRRRSSPKVAVDMIGAVRDRIIAAVRKYGDAHSAITDWNGQTATIRSTNRVCFHCDEAGKPRIHPSNGAYIRLERDGTLRYRCFSNKCPNHYTVLEKSTGEDCFEATVVDGPFFAVASDETYNSVTDKVLRDDGKPCTRPLDLDANPIVMLREGLGLGKTHATVEAIHQPIDTQFGRITDPSICWLSHRISLGKDVLNSYDLRVEVATEEHRAAVAIQRAWRAYKSPDDDPYEHSVRNTWDHYMDPYAFLMPHRVMVQIDSTYRLMPRSNNIYTPDVLVLDEIHDLMRQLVSSRARVDNWRQLLRMARSAKRIVAMDGLADRLAHVFWKAIGRPAHWRENTFKPRSGVHHHFVHWAAGLAHIHASLKAGKKLFVPCASKSQLLSLEQDLVAAGYVCKSIHADTPQEQRQAMFRNLSEQTRDCDCFLMSPTITSGCSIDHAEFDHTVFMLSTGSVVADVVWQMVWRVRNIQSKEIWYACDNTVGGGAYHSMEQTANRLLNPARLKSLVIQRSRETDSAVRNVSSRELRELNQISYEAETLRKDDSLWHVILEVANEQDNRRHDMLPRLYAIIGHSGGVLHALPTVAKDDRVPVKTRRRDRSAEFQALSDAQDVSATTYDDNRRQRNRGEATEVQKHEISRYELRVAFGKAMPAAPSAVWFKTYHNRVDQYRRISLLDGSKTLKRAHAVRSRMAVETKLGRETSHANCSMTDGDWIVCAVELMQSMGFTNHLDASTVSKADVLARLESTQAIVAGWNSARKGVSTSGSRSLCTTIKAVKGILEAAIGVYITNVGTKKKPRYGIVGVHERDAPRFKSGRKKHTKSKPPIWDLDGSDITTR